MTQQILNFSIGFVRWLADNTSLTFSLQVYNTSTGVWDTVLTLNAATNSEQITMPKLLNASGGISQPTQFASLAANYANTTTNPLSTGTGITITPTDSKIQVDGHAVAQNNTASDGWTVSVYRSTVGIPAQGAAPAGGDTVVYSTTRSVSSANQNFSCGFEFVDSGLTPNTTYYCYITIAAVTGGTATAVGGTNQTSLIVKNV